MEAASGVELSLVVNEQDAIQARVLDGSYGLPAMDGHNLEPRPVDMMPEYGYDGMTMLVRSVEF